MEGWQQFVVHARDERGDGISDYMIEVLAERDGEWVHVRRYVYRRACRTVRTRVSAASMCGCRRGFAAAE